ncbi:TetR family transcriptional regulator [Haematobacter missouriensis]|uniref:TetR family transcriptional regulator n=1 Tax=Haematobacter missouriensis TaxID=366616 RepID=A0A212AMR4_9RHOB|nr:TetR/AcrR family transcriptional regulator [Haematobacter missouriensis]KFI32371.1 TetR family transcriptional regulator [Haematobacter missouriensis]OWJ71102.1 TetR family transcriptional regulator [Haematobacter missouriensis]OWJ82804.1 TetR family transcriptional regulator [Haematobacter missouriensis]
MSTDAPLPRPATRGPSPAKTQRTQAAILDAAMAEFLEYGVAGARMDRIARRGGMAKGTPYRYYPTKEALFEGVVQRAMDERNALRDTPAFLPGETLGQHFRRVMLPVAEQLEASGRASLARLVLAEGGASRFLAETYFRSIYEPTNAYISAAIRMAIARGEVCDPRLAANPQLLVAPLWVAMVEGGVLNPGGEISAASLMELQISLFFS